MLEWLLCSAGYEVMNAFWEIDEVYNHILTHANKKIMKKATIVRLKQVTHVKNEIALLRTMDHPGLVKMSGMFQTDEHLYLVLEYVNGGELFSHLRSAVRFPNHQVSGQERCNTIISTWLLHEQRSRLLCQFFIQ